MEQFDQVTAVFSPKNLETLKEEAVPFIGMSMVFEAMWKIDDEDGGPYVGQWAMGPRREYQTPFVWVPEEDLLNPVLLPHK